SPKTLKRAPHEFIRRPHLRIEFLRRLGGDCLSWAAPAVQKLSQTFVYRAVHLVLCLQVSKPEHRAARRNDARICISQGLQALEAADDAANPPTRRPVDDRPALARYGTTYDKDILLWEMNVQIAIRVRCIRDVAVADAGVELTGCVERLTWLAYL